MKCIIFWFRKDVELVPSNVARIVDTATYIHDKKSYWHIETMVFFDTLMDFTFDVDFVYHIKTETAVYENQDSKTLRGQPGGLVNTSVFVSVPKVRR